MATADRPLNSQVQILDEAETKIRLVVKRLLTGTTKRQADKEVSEIIREAVSRLDLAELKTVCVSSLINFYNRQYCTILSLYGGDFYSLLLLRKLTEPNVPLPERQKIFTRLKTIGNDFDEIEDGVANVGVPTQSFMKDYINGRVKPVLDELAKQTAIDTGDISGRNSLRNRAEMEVRYAKHLDDIAALKASGVRLVIASVHSDCSERCSRWQGKVYSLDGTTGTTDDGRSYQPLEKATDIFYTTKAGKTYKNGLLGFNCRHFLVPYKKGYRFPKPNAEEERKQRQITERQRALERTVRRWEVKAIEAKGIDDKGYKEALKRAKVWRGEYIRYSKKNGRAFYPSRLAII